MTKRKVSKLLSLLACLSSLTLNVSCGKENSSFPAPSPSETPSEKISQEEKESTSEEDDSFLSDEKQTSRSLPMSHPLTSTRKQIGAVIGFGPILLLPIPMWPSGNPLN